MGIRRSGNYERRESGKPINDPFYGIGADRQYSGFSTRELSYHDEEKILERDLKKNKVELSAWEQEEIQSLFDQKVSSIGKISPKYQRRIRTSLNETRKNSWIPEILYEHINPMKNDFDEQLAQLVVDSYNNDIQDKIDAIVFKKAYPKVLWDISKRTSSSIDSLFKRVPHKAIPQIAALLNIDPNNVASANEQTKQQIVAAFKVNPKKFR